MKMDEKTISNASNRRSFLKTGLAVAGAATVGTGLLVRAQAQGTSSDGSLTQGDTAILQFLAAGEALEADFYTQYNELGGTVPHSAGQHCNRIERKATPYEPDAANGGHQLVDALSEQHE